MAALLRFSQKGWLGFRFFKSCFNIYGSCGWFGDSTTVINTFLFIFDNEPDWHRVSFEPWHFDRALLVLNDVIILPHPNVGSDSLASIV